MATENEVENKISAAWDELVLKALNYANGVMDNTETAADSQTAISVAVIGTFGPTPLGVEDYVASMHIATAEAVAAAKAGNQPANPAGGMQRRRRGQ